jgi:CRISPR-associated endonuclease/helicase Cas3
MFATVFMARPFLPGLVDHDGGAVPSIVSPELSRALYQQEDQRITLRVHDATLNVQQLSDFVLSKPGPRLVVLNTVNNAAVLARHLRQNGTDTLHLSTALTPYDRARIMQLILDKLEREPDGNWVLVATSCIEAGMDFSLRSGFREHANLSSLVQTGGRVNRNATWGEAEIWSIRLADDKFTQNPAFLASRQVLATFLNTHATWGELPDLSIAFSNAALHSMKSRGLAVGLSPSRSFS